MKQHTLKNSFTLAGKGLHTGAMVHARFLPAEENEGIRICRVDLEGKPCFPALADYVSATERGTVLSNGEWKISTVEHALSALSAMGVDNCLIEVDGPEMPILDGSAKYYVEEIQKTGLREQKADAKVFVVRRKMQFEQNGCRIVLLPDDYYSLDVHISFHSPVLNNQYASIEDFREYPSEVAPARTFCFVREVRPLLGMGLIKGGDLQNALVIYDEEMEQSDLNTLALGLGQETHDATRLGYLSPLKFDNEPARHKLLDLIGDLSLLGCRIQGKVIAVRPGHTVNTTFCRMLRQEMKKTAQQMPVVLPTDKPLLEREDICCILPHRDPMLLVDKVYQVDAENIVATKVFTTDEPFFKGHFPGEPIVPGVLLVEAMAQAGGILVLHDKEDASLYSTYLMKADHTKFRRKVVPGEMLVMHLKVMEPMRRGVIVMRAEGFVNNQLAVEAELTAQVIKNKE